MSDYTAAAPGPFDSAAAELPQASAYSTSATLPSISPATQPGAAGVYAVGSYRVGDAEDTLLNGHPDIRY